jgi:alkylation response protein AidB-like acyl-CoA dehydrogenase
MADGATDLDAFRSEVRVWLEANCPASMRTPMPEDEVAWGGRNPSFKNKDAKTWLDAMAGKGFTAPRWAKEYGGAGLTVEQDLVLQGELRRIKARPALFSFGLWMFGPALLEYGDEAQKREHLPKIARGDIRWCQGYSEPGAGSDLAALQTRCEDKGDHYLINGQKIWTSYANEADWMFCLVRTDTSVKHEGISFILFDMTSPGIETRPIKLISGSSPFCETFLTDVKVPKENLVGRLGGGWEIAKRLLQYERQSISASGFGGAGGLGLVDIAKTYAPMDNGMMQDGDLRARIADQLMADRAFGLTVQRAQEMAKSGAGVSHMASVFKVAAASLNQKKTELMLETMGGRALGWSGADFAPQELKVTRDWLRAKGNSIEGGTTEVNLNVVAKRVLGLRDHQ